ncbi:MAG TPA: glutamyl-tRNA reductase [Myxococcales bacterium]|nr:glutamyl-tRNA reductase [Myxococcales bacterium]
MPVFVCTGLSHKQAPIGVREQLAVDAEQLPGRLARLKAIPGVREAMLLSTCNRLEVFAITNERTAADDLLRDLGPLAAEHAITRYEHDALVHLFRVTASLDSMVVGEAQIQGQVKDAHARALEAGVCGPALTRALSAALAAAKRIRTETAVARGAVSVSSVAVQMARKVLGDLSGRIVLLVGAGEMAQLAARELHAGGASQLLVANRSSTAAEALAKEVSGIAVSLLELPALLERADVVLCSTASQQPLVTRDLVARVLKARRYRPLFLIDLALPRNIEPSANQLENVYVYDMDDLERIAAQNRELREQEVQRAEAIVLEEITAYSRAKQERTAVPVLARLRAQAQALADAEVERTLSLLGPLSDRHQKSVRAMAVAIVNKLLHGPTARLREERGGPLADAVAELFGLQDDAVAPVVESAQKPGQSPAEADAAHREDPTPGADILSLTGRK